MEVIGFPLSETEEEVENKWYISIFPTFKMENHLDLIKSDFKSVRIIAYFFELIFKVRKPWRDIWLMC